MLRRTTSFLRIVISFGLAIWFSCWAPGLALADAMNDPAQVTPDANAATAPVIITEILTGTKTSGSQEFIELYNTTDDPIDLSGWQVWYVSALAANPDKPAASGIISLGDNAAASIIAAHGYYVLSGRSDYLPDLAQQFYTGTLAATGGNLRLLSPDGDNPCELEVQDQVAWGNGLYAQGTAAAAPATGQSTSRLRYQDGSYVDTHNNAADFAAGIVTPGQPNANTSALPSEDSIPAPVPVTVSIIGCTTPTPIDTSGEGSLQQPSDNDAPPSVVVASPTSVMAATPTFPAHDTSLVVPQLTELLPNPAPPATDAKDEFVELYNSNAVAFDLSGFALKVGLTTTHRYLFPAGTSLPPKSFTAFFSSQTGLSLSNNGGQVALLDPFGVALIETALYSTAKDGEAWILANGSWQWSTVPTPGAQNIVVQELATASRKSPTSSASKTKTVTAPKKLSPKPVKSTKPKTVAQAASPASASPPAAVHPVVVAGVAVFALLYGLYEYRQDVANKIYQFRANRTARRAARPEIEGG